MYLSRIWLDTERRDTIKAMAAPSKFHGAVENAFSSERDRKLWRLDSLNGKMLMLVVSKDMPDLAKVADQFGYTGKYETKLYDPLFERIENGSRWKFCLTANPTCKKTLPSGKKLVCAHITAKYQEKWLADKAENYGFSVSDGEFLAVQSKWYKFYKRDNRMVDILSVTYDGVLTVTDADKFKETLCKGIGRGKAYGMGMLTVVRYEK